ncbi:uncharacterized protein CC84DRAFT_1168936 [Paraphaeosphaeria sporulosa]|uniref:Uncharacterized protein n=1 Tax=Paraphaeosphaeria sporulosa TaxID=1460663 RepID=A0A177BXH8_9PLEO|nr:uncharacterized protein CC84DRAFT_1168936 [Paraphaeosphaeria sporulosa]OAG00053.1 hypothetical protein CC84DRAFT_1168936 [Paraphaeosphaeria sporulosa]
MADLATAPVVLPVGGPLPEKEPKVQTNEIQLDDETNELGDSQQKDEDVALTARQLFAFWDGVTHCAEPENYKEITAMLQQAVDEEDQATPALVQNESVETPAAETEPEIKVRVINDFEYEFMGDKYQISWNAEGKPERHPAWPSEFCLVVNDEDATKPYFQVFKNKLESLIVDTQHPEPTSHAWPELVQREPAHLVYQLGRKYVFGPSSLDEDGLPILGCYPHADHFNYAEHAILGDRLRLKFSETETVRAGDRRLNLENGNKLTYGQINGLGGDFFATNNPICTGSSFEQQCQYFLDAYNLLGKAASGSKEAPLIDSINAKEMKAVEEAIQSGRSTKQVYKDLSSNDPSSVSALPITGTDEKLTKATMERDGPSYARMALLNLDHFGDDAHTAYNAGHTCALRAAAAGKLDIAYAMNAFADHYLGDCFASGHIRTPRRTLHSPADAIEKVCSIINDIYQEVTKGMNAESKKQALLQGAKDAFVLPYLTAKLTYHARDILAIAPDVCSKFMHDEDNKRGLVVRNKRGDQWAAFGDSMLFESANDRNLNYMKEALQASADEVYQAYVTKQVPSDVNGFAAWRIAPSEVLAQHCHRPLFTPNGHYRTKYSEPYCSDYSDPKSWKPKSWKPWDLGIPMDYPRLMKALSDSDYFKNL